jgi:hypothetical protein
MSGKDFVHVEIPGLCIGGGGVSVDSSEQCGHLFLMRNTEGAEKARFKYYQEKILIPGINLQWKKYCNFDIVAGTSSPDKATAVAWCDGDLSQVYAVTQSAELFTENKTSPQTNRMQLAPVLSSQPNLPLCSESSRRSNQDTRLGTYQWIYAP